MIYTLIYNIKVESPGKSMQSFHTIPRQMTLFANCKKILIMNTVSHEQNILAPSWLSYPCCTVVLLDFQNKINLGGEELEGQWVVIDLFCSIVSLDVGTNSILHNFFFVPSEYSHIIMLRFFLLILPCPGRLSLL